MSKNKKTRSVEAFGFFVCYYIMYHYIFKLKPASIPIFLPEKLKLDIPLPLRHIPVTVLVVVIMILDVEVIVLIVLNFNVCILKYVAKVENIIVNARFFKK